MDARTVNISTCKDVKQRLHAINSSDFYCVIEKDDSRSSKRESSFLPYYAKLSPDSISRSLKTGSFKSHKNPNDIYYLNYSEL